MKRRILTQQFNFLILQLLGAHTRKKKILIARKYKNKYKQLRQSLQEYNVKVFFLSSAINTRLQLISNFSMSDIIELNAKIFEKSCKISPIMNKKIM